MDAEEFRKAGKEVIDLIVDYIENIKTRNVLPDVERGFLRKVLPELPPQESESWQQIRDDFNKHIMKGVTHWISPMFNAYFPSVQSYPSILGEILSAGIYQVGLNWITSPSMNELEVVVLDWMAKMLGLPEHFLSTSKGPGGGVIHTSASESILIMLIAAKEKMINKILKERPELDESYVRGRLVFYSSEQSNSCVEKAGKLGNIVTRLLPSDVEGRLTLETLQKAVEHDTRYGYFPCCVVITIGTTPLCAFDHLEDIGPYCAEKGIWLHIDAAFAGVATACPEFRHLNKGVEYADSYVTNPHKWLMVQFYCSTFWIKDYNLLIDVMGAERAYLKDEEPSKDCPIYRHWEIPLGRTFRSLKLWFTLRSFGVKGIQKHIRNSCNLAQKFKEMVESDPRFEVFYPVNLSLAVFRVKGCNQLSLNLLDAITATKKLYMVGAELHGLYYIRYSVAPTSTITDVQNAWKIIASTADSILPNFNIENNHSN